MSFRCLGCFKIENSIEEHCTAPPLLLVALPLILAKGPKRPPCSESVMRCREQRALHAPPAPKLPCNEAPLMMAAIT
jgi:hypothetical protein